MEMIYFYLFTKRLSNRKVQKVLPAISITNYYLLILVSMKVQIKVEPTKIK